jgi:ketosteroid isomerase-like protein
MLTKLEVKKIISVYQASWEKKDTSQIPKIFTENATYKEKALGIALQGLDEIMRYWDQKVVQGQDNINFELNTIYIDRNTAIVEWEVKFDDLVSSVRKHLKEIAVLKINKGKISSFHEYWDSKVI